MGFTFCGVQYGFAQKSVHVTLDSGNLSIDSANSSPHALPKFHLFLPIATLDNKSVLLSASLDAFWDSVGSIHLDRDIFGIYLPALKSNLARRKTEFGFNILLLRREKMKRETFFIHPYHAKIEVMETYSEDVRVQKSWSGRLGGIWLQNPMVNVNYAFQNGGQAGIPVSINYTDSNAKANAYLYLGIGRVRKRIFKAQLNISNAIQPSVSKYTFYYFDLMYMRKKMALPSSLPYTDNPQDKPIYAGVSPIDKIPKTGFRFGLFGMVSKAHQLPYFYQAEFGSYPGYMRNNSYYLRLGIGFRLVKI